MRIVYFLLAGLLFFTSCYTPRYLYSPSAQNIPVLVNKGDSKLAAYLSSNLSSKKNNYNRINESKNRGFDLQGAYAFSNHFAVQASYFNRVESNNGFKDGGNLDSAFINYKRNLTEAGFGYFVPLNDDNEAMFQVFAGAGKGKFSFTDNGKDEAGNDYSRIHEATITKWYIQPALMLRSEDNFAFSFSSRCSFINYSHIKTNYTPAELMYYKLADLANGSTVFWEPALTTIFGFKKLPGIQFESQVETSIRLTNRYLNHRAFNFSLAIVLDLPKLLHPKKARNKKQ
jgi:hypothetical protein